MSEHSPARASDGEMVAVGAKQQERRKDIVRTGRQVEVGIIQ